MLFLMAAGCEDPKPVDSVQPAASKTENDQSVNEAASGTPADSPAKPIVFGKTIVDQLSARVTAVTDGDTIEVETESGESLVVRLESVNAPEGNEPNSDVAIRGLREMVDRQQVKLLVTGKDGRGRTLAFVMLGDMNVNEQLIARGFAEHYKRYSDDPTLAELEVKAREQQLNIWAIEEPEPPYEGKPLAGDLSILAWNVESGGSDPDVIAQQLNEMPKHTIFGLSEVPRTEFEKYRAAVGESYRSIEGTHREEDHLQLVYDDTRLELLGYSEIDEIGGVRMNRPDRAYRSPLLARFRQRDSGAEFHVVHNHLARGNERFRQQQAEGLKEWARLQTRPVIAIGDYNFDFVFETRRGNPSFDLFLRDNVWQWIEPTELIDTNWYDPGKDGQDDYPGSMLDFSFVAGPAKELDWECTVIVRDGDFPDNETTSDHRPVLLELKSN